MPLTVNERAEKHRQGLRDQGLRPFQVWVPDTRLPGFQEEIARQCRLCDEADAKDNWWEQLTEEALQEMAESGEWEPL